MPPTTPRCATSATTGCRSPRWYSSRSASPPRRSRCSRTGWCPACRGPPRSRSAPSWRRPDAAAATAILRQVKLPYRLLKILEGESLLNDASALLIYRVAVGAAAMEHFRWSAFAPAIVLALAGSLIAGLSVRKAVDGGHHAADHGCAERDHRAVRRHLHGVDRRRAYRPVRHSDHRRLCHHRRAHRAGANAGAAAGAVLRGVGNGGVRAQRAGLRADRHAAAADLGAAR